MSKAKPIRAKSAAALRRANHRAAIRELEQIAVLEAVEAFYAVSLTLSKSPEMKSPALARIRSGTVLKIMRAAFEYATSGGVRNGRKVVLKAPALPFRYLRLPMNAPNAKAEFAAHV